MCFAVFYKTEQDTTERFREFELYEDALRYYKYLHHVLRNIIYLEIRSK